MKILQISPQIPYPLVDGGKIGIYGITKGLNELGHDIDFITYLKDSDYTSSFEALNKICNPVIVRDNTNNSILGAFLNFFSAVPYNIAKFERIKFKNELVKLLKANKYDIVHVDHLHMAWTIKLVKEYQDIPVVLRQHNLEQKIMKRYSEEAKNPVLKIYSSMQYKKFVEYEAVTCGEFDQCIMITEVDEKELLKLNPACITSVVPAGVDDSLLEIERTKIEPYSIFHIGSMDWLPNKSGLEWYLTKIFPEVIKRKPQTKLYLIGKGTDKFPINETIAKNVFPLGFVDDVWKEISSKSLAVVPLQVGSGMRLKIIEMMATGQVILSTSIGTEGIEVTNHKNILLADSEEEFINKTVEYFDNKFDAGKLSENAKTFIAENYKWSQIAKQFENIYNKIDLLKNR